MSAESDPIFDAYAADYDEALHRGVSLSGERKEYFAEARIAWTKRRAQGDLAGADLVMDYGCGDGSAVPFLRAHLKPRRILGIDVSPASLQTARDRWTGDDVCFMRPEDYAPRGRARLVYSNGTMHHIHPRDRPRTVQYIYRALEHGGVFALWENNWWNPGTRMVMRRIPFDRDAMPVSAPAARRLLRQAGFRIRCVDFLFVFPHALRALRCLEPLLARLPLGAQYCVFAERP